MTPIRIPVTLSPHVVNETPRGYYVLAQRLFPNGAPILTKQQWIGYANGCLIITVNVPHEWNSLLKMAINCPTIGTLPVTWLAPAKLWPMPKGFRSYIPGFILKPNSSKANKIEMTGIFKQYLNLFWLELPKVSGEILLGRSIFNG